MTGGPSFRHLCPARGPDVVDPPGANGTMILIGFSIAVAADCAATPLPAGTAATIARAAARSGRRHPATRSCVTLDLPLAFFGFWRPGDGPTTPHAGRGANRNRDRCCDAVQSETAAANLAVRCLATAASRLVPKSLSITAAAPGPARSSRPMRGRAGLVETGDRIQCAAQPGPAAIRRLRRVLRAPVTAMPIVRVHALEIGASTTRARILSSVRLVAKRRSALRLAAETCSLISSQCAAPSARS